MNPYFEEHPSDADHVIGAIAENLLMGGWSVRPPEKVRFPSEQGIAPEPDIVAEVGSGTWLFEVKRYGGEGHDSALAAAASAAGQLRRSLPEAPNARAALVLLLGREEPHLLWDLQERAPGSFAALASRLMSKNGYDAVLILERLGSQCLVALRGGRNKVRTVDSLDLALDALRENPNSKAARPGGSAHPAGSTTRWADAGHTRPPSSFLLVADEWNPGKGGISSFNRELARALKAAGKEVCVYLPSATSHDVADAETLGIDLAIPAETVPGLTGASALLAHRVRHLSKERYRPDVIVGHGRVLGPHAYFVQGMYQSNQSPLPLRVHIVHTDPELLELAKEGDIGEPRTREAQERRRLEIELAEKADVVAGVGPSLFAWINDALRAIDRPTPTIRIDPGLRDWGTTRDPGIVPSTREFLVVGRVEDFESKGIELAIRAVGTALQGRPNASEGIRLALRGVPRDHALLRTRVNEIANEYGLQVVFRQYSEDVQDVKTDLRQAIAVLMPSPHEGFGLSAYEAIAIGTPVIVSAESGLSRLLEELRSEGRITAGIRNPSASGTLTSATNAWETCVTQVLNAPASALREAGQLRTEIASLDLWTNSLAELDRALMDSLRLRSR